MGNGGFQFWDLWPERCVRFKALQSRPRRFNAKAQVLVPGLLLLDGEPDADAAALERLAIWMLQRYAPVVASDPPDGIVIDTTGSNHLHGGEGAMLTEMVHRLSGSGIAARAAVADSWGAAHAAARYAGEPISVVELGKSLKAISPSKTLRRSVM